MRQLLKKGFVLYFTLFVILICPSFSIAEQPSLDETQKLLNKGLTIYEIDREVSRLSGLEEEVIRQLKETEQKIAEHQQASRQARERAGQVLRAYYMGDRDILLLTALFSTDRLVDVLAVFDFLQIIYESDQTALQRYAEDIRELEDLHAELQDKQNQLRTIKAQFLAQRERLAGLQRELDSQLAAQSGEEKLKEQIAALTSAWEKQGLPVFQTYLKALAKAMRQLPEILGSDESQVITEDGVQITDRQLNDFLRSKNPLFEHLTFTFEKGYMVAQGSKADMQIALKGHYTLETEPENVIRFQVDELTFNGYTLPDTTGKSLQKNIDLNIYPQQFSDRIEITDVDISPGQLTLQIKLNFDLSGLLR